MIDSYTAAALFIVLAIIVAQALRTPTRRNARHALRTYRAIHHNHRSIWKRGQIQ